jgi:hypothetical protein
VHRAGRRHVQQGTDPAPDLLTVLLLFWGPTLEVLSRFGYLTRLEVWRPLRIRDPVLRSSCLVCDMFCVSLADGVLVSRICASPGRDAREDAPPHREPAHPAAGLPAGVQEGRESGASLVPCVSCAVRCGCWCPSLDVELFGIEIVVSAFQEVTLGFVASTAWSVCVLRLVWQCIVVER